MNERIKQELLQRIKKAEAELPELSDEVKPLYEYYQKQSVKALAKKVSGILADELFEHWPVDETLQAGGFEWYYDGASLPDGLGYGYASVTKLPDLPALDPDSEDYRARDDFDGEVDFGSMVFGDSGGFDVTAACFPLYEFIEAEVHDDEEDEDAVDALINLFTLRMFYAVHLAVGTVLHEKAPGLDIKLPFFFFANNHDWSPFLIYAFDGTAPEDPGLGVSTNTVVDEMADWLASLGAATEANQNRDEFIGAMGKQEPAALETTLLGLPKLKDGSSEVDLTADELKNFAGQTLSHEDYTSGVSFKAFAHFFDKVLTEIDSPDVYDLKNVMTFLFVNDPAMAYQHVSEAANKYPEKKEGIVDCAKNSVRWAEEKWIEERWPNPTLALSRSSKARKMMAKVAEL